MNITKMKHVFTLVVFFICLSCMIKIFVSSLHPNWSDIDSKKQWENYGEKDITYHFFSNANQWHYNLNHEMAVACAVVDYSERKGLKEEWTLKKINARETKEHKTIMSAYVCSATGREAYLLLEGRQYLIIADIVKGNGLTVKLGEGDYSYGSSLSWFPYQDGKEGEDILEYSVRANDDACIYESVYLEEGILAMENYLALVKNDKGIEWHLMENMIYIGANGYLADLWFTSDSQRVHIVVDIWNRLYSVVEVYNVENNNAVFLKACDTEDKNLQGKWTRLQEAEDMEKNYFSNLSAWYYNQEAVKAAACAVRDYSCKTGLEQEKWELTHMYCKDGIISAFVRSEDYRELFLLIKGNAWILIADVKREKGLEVPLMDNGWSYHSVLDWYSYKEWADQNPDFVYSILSSDDYDQYDSIYGFQAAAAIQGYLSSVNADRGETWEVLYDWFFVGSNGCLADVWYTNGKENVHLVIDVWNKLYTVTDQ